MNVLTAYSGTEALDRVVEHKPDLILLDVMMPEMDGVEVCRRLKEMSGTQNIPVIFITARNSRENKLEGLNAGAADYITKPIDLDETIARVNTQLRIQENHRKNLDLQQRLADARQAAATGAITQGIAHNLNNLLGVVVGYVDLLKSAADNPDLVRRSSTLIDKALKRMVTIVQQLSTIATDERPHFSPVTVEEALDSAVRRFCSEYKVMPDIKIINPLPSLIIQTNLETFEDVLCRLLINAWESYHENATPDQREICIMVERLEAKQALRISVNDRGMGIDPEIEAHAFEPFISGKTAVGRGMGLTIARHGIQTLGGDIHLRRRSGGGTTAVIDHPLEDTA